MSDTFYSRELVSRQLAISHATLLRYESRGLVRAIPADAGPEVGYGPGEVRRLWTIVTFQRDLGINLAGVEVILRLRDQLGLTHANLARLAHDLQALAEADDATPIDGDVV